MTFSKLSWGRAHPSKSNRLSISTRNSEIPKSEESILPFGLGRSYGDSCLNNEQAILETRTLNKFISFDKNEGIVEAEAGVSLDEILKLIVPNGWFLPTTPGTKFVTLGGAIANDVHGKNHHVAGTIGNNLIDLELLRSDGTRFTCSIEEKSDWFFATIGGLGLTGLITKARLKLRKIESSYIDTYSKKFANLDEFFEISKECDPKYEHTVSWIDCLSKGDSLGRGVYMGGNHGTAPDGTEDPFTLHAEPKITAPIDAPDFALNPLTVRAFNFLYYNKQLSKEKSGKTHFEPFFYPLDAINEWNRIYGKRGFYQYQSVVPLDVGTEATKEMLEVITESGQASFLAVLKKFGDVKPVGMLSFPRTGVTLALDFPNNGQKTEQLFDKLDQIVKSANGILYPAKDGRMSAEDFQSFYPQWEEFSKYIDPKFSSDFWRRATS